MSVPTTGQTFGCAHSERRDPDPPIGSDVRIRIAVRLESLTDCVVAHPSQLV
jgi:hypothetical protein